MFATFLIGLREGLEAALVVGMLVAYVSRIGRRDVLPRLWVGVSLAVVISLAIGAVLTFGTVTLTFQAQEIIGGLLSLVAVAMVTWMVFWMQRTASTMKASLEGHVDRALAIGGLWAIVTIGFISVAREGIETTLLLWSMVQSFGDAPSALLGAVLGLASAVALGWLLARGLLRLNLSVFFAWTGVILVIAAAGVLAYAFMDLAEAGVVPGPFSEAAPIDPVTDAVAVGWSAFPFGWAFDLSAVIPPGSPLAAILQATVGFMPRMTWIQVVAWVFYIAIVGTFFVRGLRRGRRSARSRPTVAPAASADAARSSSVAPTVLTPPTLQEDL